MSDFSNRDLLEDGDAQRRLIEAKRQQQAEAARQRAAAAAQKNKKPKAKETPSQAAQAAQPVMDPRGIVTQAGEWLQHNLNPANIIDDEVKQVAGAINSLPDNGFTRPLKAAANEIDRLTMGQKEIDQLINVPLDRMKASDNEAVASAGNFLEMQQGIDLGVKAGAMIPMTIAARLTGQEASWSQAPAILQDNPMAKQAFKIAEVLAPTLVGGGVATALGRGALTTSLGGIAAESALETSTQANVDDLIAGRQVAQAFGEIADHLGYDGGALTRDIIENKSIKSKAFVGVVGFLQNLGINFTATKVLDLVTSGSKPSVVEGADEVARVLGRNTEEVNAALKNVNEPNYSNLTEPHQAMDIDSQVPVVKASNPDDVISDVALIKEARRSGGIGEDGLTAADRTYFSNWKAVASDSKMEKVVQDATSTLRALKSAPSDVRLVLSRALDWWQENRYLLDDGGDRSFRLLAENFKDDLTKPLNDGAAAVMELVPEMPVSRVLKEWSVVSEEGFIASQMVAEELGVRVQKAARVAMNLETQPTKIDFTDAINTILDLHDKMNLFLVPLRRAKRKWYVDGMSQQRKSLKRVKDADVVSYRTSKQTPSADAPSRELETISRDATDPGNTVRELWNAAQEGDTEALGTLKTYLNLIAYSDPSTVLTQATKLTNVLTDQLKQGNKEAASQLFYAYMLSRVGTQVASASSNVMRLVLEPLGAALTGEKAYAKGQIVGLLTHLSEGRKAFVRSMKEGAPLNSGTKIDAEVFNLKARQLQLDERYKGALNELGPDATDMERLQLSSAYTAQTWGNHPANNIAARLLTSADEATKALFGSQVATGRAYREAAENGTWENIEAITKKHFERVFKNGVVEGKIIDADVLEGAKQLTFQTDIPVDGNLVDNLFLAVKQGAESSAVMRFFSPFTRVSHSILETAGRYAAGDVLAKFVPRYKKIIAGEMGDVAKMQLESQIALGRSVTMSTVGMAWMGLTTGYNSGNLPRTSFIIPAPFTETGYIAVNYSKLEPFASIIAVTTDAVQGLRDEVLSQGQYDRYIQELIFSLGMASTDKTFQSGLTDMAAMLDVKNFGEGNLKALANAGGSLAATPLGAGGALMRMVGDWANPYATIQAEQGSAWNTYWAQFRQRQFGGAGNPPLYDELDGKLIPKTTTIGPGDNYWAAVGASMVNEFAYPGRIKGAKPNDPLRKLFNELNFKPDVISSIRTLDGVPLSLKQQSELSKVLHLSLRPKLEGYFKSDRYKTQRAKFDRFRFDNPAGNTGEGSRSNVYMERIHQDLKRIYREAKLEAAKKSKALMEDPDFQKKRRAARIQTPMSSTPSSWQGIHSVLGMTNK